MRIIKAIGLMLTFLVSVFIQTNLKAQTMENRNQQDNSNKRILARGCSPQLSHEFAKVVPSLTGNALYIPTTNDEDFFEMIKTKKWSVIYFAPGACRYSAAKQRIPGSNSETKSWTLEEYKTMIYKYQGDKIQIVETPLESESIQLLNEALKNAREIE